MEKAVAQKMNNEPESLLNDDQKINDKQKRQKGPKTIVKEKLLSISGDPLGLNVSFDLEPKEETTKNRVKSKDDILIERYNPDCKVGLTTEESEMRMIAGMANTVDTGSSKSILGIFISNIFTFFNMLMIGIAIWLISVKAFGDLFFMGVVLLNLAISIIQEIKAKKTIDKLSLLTAPTVVVIRDSNEVEISVSDVVIDDILFLNSGKQIPADSILREGHVEVNEALLTGEADPIIKRAGDTLYSGSFVVSGSCLAQAIAIGKDIYIQKLTNQAKKYKKPKSDLLGSLKTIIRIVGVLILPLAAAYYYLMVKGDVEYVKRVTSTSAAMIGMIPAGLFLLTSTALAVGVIRLGQNNTLVQELYCIEMLARVDTLCLDKTGTITDGTMTVKSIIEFNNDKGLPIKQVIPAMLNALNDNNLTSEALKERFGTAKRIRHKELIPFSSSRKYSAVQFDRYGTYVIGAPEYVLKKNYQLIANEVEKQATEGYRVLLLASSNKEITDNQITGTITPLALIMIEDTIRPDAIETIEYFKKNSVNIKVISGDNPKTVSRISTRAGIDNADQYISLEGMLEKDVVRAADRYTIFGRVSPAQKKVLIEALKNNGHVVAMTGDGVNDILALKEADTSIAMASGSEAARNVSHLVLLDSNFSSMPKVVSEGRRVINNVQRVSALFLTKTIFSFLLLTIALIRQGVYPISPRQLNLIDIFVIGIPAFFLALEANNKLVKGKFLWNVIKAALPGALVVMINSLIIFAFAKTLNMDQDVTSTLIVISATFTSICVFYRVSTPFNKMRRILFISMITIILTLILVAPHQFKFAPFYEIEFYPIDPLSVPQILLLIAIMQATYPLIYILSNIYRWTLKLIRTILKVIADIE